MENAYPNVPQKLMNLTETVFSVKTHVRSANLLPTALAVTYLANFLNYTKLNA